MDPTAEKLIGNPDPMVWAEEFIKLFNGKQVTDAEGPEAVDVGLMVGWFSNAMGVSARDYIRLRASTSLLVKHAKTKLAKVTRGRPLGFPEREVLALVELFASQGHSGDSAQYTLARFKEILDSYGQPGQNSTYTQPASMQPRIDEVTQELDDQAKRRQGLGTTDPEDELHG